MHEHGLVDHSAPGASPKLTAKSMRQEGGSCIIGPNGDIVAGPLIGEGIVAAELSAQSVVEARGNLDASGHYSRKDVLRLEVLGPNAAASR